jgi:predicted  nucleic acid-binding Zn-ribbon protein
MEEEDELAVSRHVPGHVQPVPMKKEPAEIRSTSPTASLEVAQLKKEVRSLQLENAAMRRELDTARENLRLSTSALQGLREHLRALVDKYIAEQGESEVELQGLDLQAKDIIERIQTVASRLEEDNAMLVELLREAIK